MKKLINKPEDVVREAYHTADVSMITDSGAWLDFGETIAGKWAPTLDYTVLDGTATYALQNIESAFAWKSITGATDATPIRMTVTSHGYDTGDIIWVFGMGSSGNTAANLKWCVVRMSTPTPSTSTTSPAMPSRAMAPTPAAVTATS